MIVSASIQRFVYKFLRYNRFIEIMYLLDEGS